MAWIAFAAVNLAAMGTAYRMAWPAQRPQAIGLVVALLMPIEVLSVLGVRLVRAIRHALSDPACEDRDALLTPCVCLFFTVVAVLGMAGLLGGVLQMYRH
jgi:uncharacterized membrane protein SpoIIM required for sporulation